MTEHPNSLWRVETSHKEHSSFHVLACCLMEAADKAQSAIGENEIVFSIEMVAPLLVEDDDDGEEEEDDDDDDDHGFGEPDITTTSALAD